MKAGTIILLLLIVALAVACSKTTPPNQVTTDTTLDDQNLEGELTSDTLEDIGTLDEIPVDDSIPE